MDIDATVGLLMAMVAMGGIVISHVSTFIRDLNADYKA